MAYTLEDYIKQAKKAMAADQKKAIADSDKLHTAQADTTKELYEGQIAETEKAYEDNYRENAIQKLVNEREVAENMANMGLTDSGLNRTQQTAVQLSYANQKGSIDLAKQQQIDAFKREMNTQLAGIEQSRLAGAADIKSKYSQAAIDSGTTAYGDYQDQVAASNKEYYDYLEKQAESDKKNSYIIKANGSLLSRDYEGSLRSNGVTCYKFQKKNEFGKVETWVRYVDDNSQKKLELPLGQSPYIDDINPNIEYGAFSNGYQPDNVGKGKKLSAARLKKDWNGHKKGETATYPKYGNDQTIWKNGGNFYIWDRKINDYVDITAVVKDIVI